MKIAVVGAGAMGSIFGARFAQAGHDTVLVDIADALVERINADGVTVLRGEEETVTRVPATADPSTVGPVDLAVFCVKCYHTESAAEFARPLVDADTVVSSLQNGWGNGDVLAQAFPAEQLVVGVTYNSGTVLDVARVAHPGVGPTTFGPFVDGDTGSAERLASALRDGGLEAIVATPIRPEIWKKLILNAATLPTAALTGMTAGTLTAHDGMHELVTDTAREAVAVARALGYDIEEEERIEYIHGLSRRAGPTKASMLQDVEAGRRTEIDVINGAVVKRETRRSACRLRSTARCSARARLGVHAGASMSTRLTYFGAAGYEIVGPKHRILIDPFLSQNPLAPCSPDDLERPDVILVSHAAFDHFGDASSIARRTGAPVICDAAVRALLLDQGVSSDQVTATTWGIVVEFADSGSVRSSATTGRPAPCRMADQVVGNPIAFIVETEAGVRIYHYGDTSVFDMRLIGELYRPTVGLLGCTLPKELVHLIPGPGTFVTGEMDADEAARTAEMLGVELAVACHYLAPDDEVDRFLKLVPEYDTSGSRRVVAPLVGETLVVDPGSHRIEGKAS